MYCLSRELNGLPEEMVLRDIMIAPETVETRPIDETGPTNARGVLNKPVCRVKAWAPGKSLEDPHDLTLEFHEYPEPTGEEIYFRLSDPTQATDDELLNIGGNSS